MRKAQRHVHHCRKVAKEWEICRGAQSLKDKVPRDIAQLVPMWQYGWILRTENQPVLCEFNLLLRSVNSSLKKRKEKKLCCIVLHISRFELWWKFVWPTRSLACEKIIFICMQSQNLKKDLISKFKIISRTSFVFIIAFMVYE